MKCCYHASIRALTKPPEDMLSQPAAPNRPYTECPEIPELQKQVRKLIGNFIPKRMQKETQIRILFESWTLIFKVSIFGGRKSSKVETNIYL